MIRQQQLKLMDMSSQPGDYRWHSWARGGTSQYVLNLTQLLEKVLGHPFHICFEPAASVLPKCTEIDSKFILARVKKFGIYV